MQEVHTKIAATDEDIVKYKQWMQNGLYGAQSDSVASSLARINNRVDEYASMVNGTLDLRLTTLDDKLTFMGQTLESLIAHVHQSRAGPARENFNIETPVIGQVVQEQQGQPQPHDDMQDKGDEWQRYLQFHRQRPQTGVDGQAERPSILTASLPADQAVNGSLIRINQADANHEAFTDSLFHSPLPTRPGLASPSAPRQSAQNAPGQYPAAPPSLSQIHSQQLPQYNSCPANYGAASG